MRVAIVFNEPVPGAGSAEADVLEQVRAVEEALAGGVDSLVRIPCSLNLQRLSQDLIGERPDVVVNLVEALGGTDRLATLVPLLLDAGGIRYMGAGSAAFLGCADKVAAKARLRRAGIPTPDWRLAGATGVDAGSLESGHVIIKSRYEHASLGMDDLAVIDAANPADLDAAQAERAARYGGAFFAERFVAGREFNIALIERCGSGDAAARAQVLPIAEIDFSAYPAHKPRIVGHAAKWAVGSFEYDATPRRFDFDATDASLLEELTRLAVSTWREFGLRGYARVDFRVDDAGRPFVLEVNPNPCLAPDAGYAAALGEAGLDLRTALTRLIGLATTG